IIVFNRGQINDARARMQTAYENFGENVNLLRDLMVCQYHLQDMMGFRENLERLQTRLVELEAELSEQSLLECEMMIGKFLEEEGRLAPARDFYQRFLNRAKKPAHRVRGLIQLARWQALYEPGAELSAYYRELISVPETGITRDLHVELEHSLMLIEMRLIGADHAWQRIEGLKGKVDDLDHRTLIFDFIEGVLAQDLDLNLAVIKSVNGFKELAPAEKFLAALIQDSLEPAQLIQELTLLSTKLLWAPYLRLLSLTANRESSPAVRQELHRKIQLIVHSLDPESQRLWTERLKQVLQTPEIKIDFSSRQRRLAVHGKLVDLSKKKIGLNLLEGLVERSTMTVEEAIQLLWQTSFTPEHYHRLRMSVHRLNQLVHEAAGLGKIVEVDSQTVRLRPEVRLRQETSFDLGSLGI
ncbi:MAG TPA: hypothetical protein PKC28_06695, partial [Bdellovibrionales bacterium]|nr:hypothetical protein [Bdellovibrionales bacterium]